VFGCVYSIFDIKGTVNSVHNKVNQAVYTDPSSGLHIQSRII
jgi:hypothetical protein